MEENKTKENEANVEKFLNSVEDEKKREDCLEILKIMENVTNESPMMWGAAMVGFGRYHYKYESGREGDCFISGFSPRKQNLTLYIMSGFPRYDELMKKLGNYKIGKSCLYIKSLKDIDVKVLKELVKASVDNMKKKYDLK